jgi:hypothetical protein
MADWSTIRFWVRDNVVIMAYCYAGKLLLWYFLEFISSFDSQGCSLTRCCGPSKECVHFVFDRAEPTQDGA